MAINQETFNNKLYDLLKVRRYDPIPKDYKNQRTTPKKADVFNFTFRKEGKEYGNAWVTIDDAANLIVYYDEEQYDSPEGKTSGLDYDDSWTGFLKHLKHWAMARQLSFELAPKDKLGDDMARREETQQESLNEGYYPINKTASYSDAVPSVKIILQHTRQIQEGEQRFRNISKIFLENEQGERILAPTVRPGIARVYARHLAEGGVPNDERWNHIKSICEEYNKMAGFVRATRGNTFNESATKLVEAGMNHYLSLRETLGKLTGHRGYNSYFESYTPPLMEDDTDANTINELFVQETLDPRIESVMPILNKLQKQISEMSETTELEEWADSVINEKMGEKATGSEDEKEFEKRIEKVLKARDKSRSEELPDMSQGTRAQEISKLAKNKKERVKSKFGIVDEEGAAEDTGTPGRLIAKMNDIEVFSHSPDDEGSMTEVRKNGEKIASGYFDRMANSYWISMGKEDKPFDSAKDVAKYFAELAPSMDEGALDTLKKVGKKVLDKLAPSDEELLKQLQKSAGIPQHAQHGKPRGAIPNSERMSEGLGDVDTNIVHKCDDGTVFKTETETQDDRYKTYHIIVSPDGKERLVDKSEFNAALQSAKKGVAEGSLNEGQYEMMMRNGQVKKFVAKDDADAKRIAAGHGAKSVIRLKGGVPAGKVSEQGVAEGLDPEKRQRLDDLIDAYRDATDPNDYYDRDYEDPEEVIDMIRQEFGDKIADQVEAGADKMHFSRPGHAHGYDPMDWKKPVDRITKAGKMYKQDSDFRKNTIKSRYKLRGKSATEGVTEGSDKLPGTPVVSLKDFSDKDTKKDKYGRTVPKKLKKDDPRVTFHKDSKQSVSESQLNEGIVDNIKQVYQSILSKAKAIPNFKQYYEMAKAHQKELVQAIRSSKTPEELQQKVEQIASASPISEENTKMAAARSAGASALWAASGLFGVWAAQTLKIYELSAAAIQSGNLPLGISSGILFGLVGQLGALGLALVFAKQAADRMSKSKEQDVAEDLDANQKRVGQLGPTEKVKNNNIGKLVGANESVELSEMDKSQPTSDRGGESSGDPYAKGGKATPITAKKAKKDFLGILNKSVDKANKAKQDTDKKVAQHQVKEGQEDLDAILRIIRK